MEKAQLTAPSKFRLFINRIIATLKVTAASALLVYAFHSSYSLAYSPGGSVSSDAEGTVLVFGWLFVFGGLSWVARFYVKRPVTFGGSPWFVSFLLVSLASSILFPLGSLFVRIYLSNVYFFGPPSPAMQKAASDMTMVGLPLTVYIHYVILAYDETDTRTLWQRIKRVIDYFMEKKARLFYLAVVLFFLYQSYPPFHMGDGSSGITGLTSIKMSGYRERITSPVGREDILKVDGIFPSGKTTDITSPIFGTKYTSSDPSVASVSNKGVVVGVAQGHAVIRVENGGHIAEIPVRIYEPTEGIILRADVDGSVLPGSEITFYITPRSGDLKFNRVSIHNEILNWKRAEKSGDIFVCTLKIPIDFTGEMHFEAYSTIDNEEEYARYTSNTVPILVKPDLSKLTGLNLSIVKFGIKPFYEARVAFPMKGHFFLRAIGIFSDGTEYNLSDPRLGTVISSSDPSVAEPVPTVNAHRPIYSVNCLRLGETEITATNNGFSVPLSLEVTEASAKN